jgi:2,3-bisphosphoglycerate-dependent phosphoglycerate mutase
VGWPAALWIVRHGQSAGNVAADRAEQANEEVVAVVDRDADVPLSALGERQARALGRWFAAMRPEDRPGSILTSPYLRAHRTALIVAEELGGTSSVGVACDERLRERELGAFDRLTRKGWNDRYPEQAELRARVGKFYHRPPGGESWCDVVLRLRSFVQDLQLRHEGGRLLVVAHRVIVLCARYILEQMDETTILRIDGTGLVANCAVTAYVAGEGDRGSPGSLSLMLANHVAPIEEAGEAVTAAPDEPVAPR